MVWTQCTWYRLWGKMLVIGESVRRVWKCCWCGSYTCQFFCLKLFSNEEWKSFKKDQMCAVQNLTSNPPHAPKTCINSLCSFLKCPFANTSVDIYAQVIFAWSHNLQIFSLSKSHTNSVFLFNFSTNLRYQHNMQEYPPFAESAIKIAKLWWHLASSSLWRRVTHSSSGSSWEALGLSKAVVRAHDSSGESWELIISQKLEWPT